MYVYECVCVSVYHTCAGTSVGPERTSDALGLELEGVVSGPHGSWELHLGHLQAYYIFKPPCHLFSPWNVFFPEYDFICQANALNR